MERQIMFRAWDEENKKMYLPDFPFIGAGSGARDIAITLDGKVITPNSYGFDVPPEQPIGKLIIEQWTGLLDKSGTKIFEGDVIRVWTKDKEGYDYVGTVVFDEAAYYIEFPVRFPLVPSLSNWANKSEVLGSIHTSPDLIK